MIDMLDEHDRARARFPGNRHLLAALMEELGELASELLQGPPTIVPPSAREDEAHRVRIREEAVQVAALAMRIALEGDADYVA